MNAPTPLTPEQLASAADCDKLTDTILEGVQGLPVGTVIGACLNVLQTAASYCNHEDRIKIAERMCQCAGWIELGEPAHEPPVIILND